MTHVEMLSNHNRGLQHINILPTSSGRATEQERTQANASDLGTFQLLTESSTYKAV